MLFFRIIDLTPCRLKVLKVTTYIKKELVLNNRGEVVNKYKTSYLDSLLMTNNDESNELLDDINNQRAFTIDLSKEIKKDISEQKLPLYIAEIEEETKENSKIVHRYQKYIRKE